jgi:hypothetical protein
MLQFFICAWLQIFRWASVNKDSASSGVYGSQPFLEWAAQTFLILNSLVGVVSNAPLKVLAASLLPADRMS